MKIILAGFNIDNRLLEKLRGGNDPVTPETISAAYARISRDPRPIDELRMDALEDVLRARKSNTNIVFGLGHSSVAEHAVFNFDLIGVSRLAVEAIESHRLNSYTEKSQRYIKLNKDFIVAEEIKNAGLADEFRDLVNMQFSAYSVLYEKLHPYFIKKHGVTEDDKKQAVRIEGLAKEDARYALPLATTAQLGMTINARNLEYLIQRLAGNPLEENRAISKALYDHAVGIAPSLIKYIKPRDIFYHSFGKSENSADTAPQLVIKNAVSGFVKLVDYDPKAEARIIAAITAYSGSGFGEAYKTADAMNRDERTNFFRNILRGLEAWDRLPREFELADFTFELVISSSCFAQLKRHRMATVISYDYDTSLGYTVPESIIETGMENKLAEIASKSEILYEKLKKAEPSAADYALTNAHRRRVLIKMNARELYHFSRLREDEHSQWDIRNIACEAMNMAREAMPALFVLACGKDKFPELLKSIYPENSA